MKNLQTSLWAMIQNRISKKRQINFYDAHTVSTKNKWDYFEHIMPLFKNLKNQHALW